MEVNIQNIVALIGLLLTAITALASTTFLANAMAGFMLRRVKNFRPGDYLSVGDYFGRVTEQGIFHTELQTEDSDLVTVPNMFMVTNPVKVVRGTGTIVSATVSLGYDVAHASVFFLLLEAAKEADLADSFVQILDLGDASITYRVAGTLIDISVLVSTRSKLRAGMLDSLHRAGVEVVSPAIVDQRRLLREEKILPPIHESTERTEAAQGKQTPEEVMFAKALKAERIQRLKDRITNLTNEIEQIQLSATEGAEQNERETQISWRKSWLKRIQIELNRLQEDLETREND